MGRASIAALALLTACSSGSSSSSDPSDPASIILGVYEGVEDDGFGRDQVDVRIDIVSVDAAEIHGVYTVFLSPPASREWVAERPAIPPNGDGSVRVYITPQANPTIGTISGAVYLDHPQRFAYSRPMSAFANRWGVLELTSR